MSLAYRCSVAGVSAAAVMTAEVAASAEIGCLLWLAVSVAAEMPAVGARLGIWR